MTKTISSVVVADASGVGASTSANFFTTSCSAYVTGIKVAYSSGKCATGVYLYFSDGSIVSSGISSADSTSLSSYLSFGNSNQWTTQLFTVNYQSGSILDYLTICNSGGTCVSGGNSGGGGYQDLANIGSNYVITGVYVDYQPFSGIDCLNDLAIYYYT